MASCLVRPQSSGAFSLGDFSDMFIFAVSASELATFLAILLGAWFLSGRRGRGQGLDFIDFVGRLCVCAVITRSVFTVFKYVESVVALDLIYNDIVTACNTLKHLSRQKNLNFFYSSHSKT